MSSEEVNMAKVKHIACRKPPSPKNDPPTPKKTEVPPPPLTDLTALPSSLPPPPSFPNIPFSIVTKKSVPSLPPIIPKLVPPPTKKVTPPGLFIKGQLGHVFFSLSSIRNYMELPHGHSLIIASFQKPFMYEHTNTKFVITDPLGNKWSSPEVFNVWRATVEASEIPDIDQKLFHVVIIRLGNEFQLCSSLCKSKYKNKFFL